MPVGTPFHERTFACCESLNYREWAGYYTVSSYKVHHDHEYNAIRNAAALIDISPLFKYRVAGPDATRLVDSIITRDIQRVLVGQVIYTSWCDEHGKVIDDGTVSRLSESSYRWTAADPSLRWLHQNALGLNVEIEDLSEETAALALQGPTSSRLLKAVVDVPIGDLGYFRCTSANIAGVPVEISRTGYTGDLGYEIWIPAKEAVKVWDVLMSVGQNFDIHPVGMLALDIARIEAALLLIDIDFISSKKALIGSQKYSPFEMGLGHLVHLDKDGFVGQAALRAEKSRGHDRQIVGLEIDWPAYERIHEAFGLPPAVSPIASRVAVPIFQDGVQVGKATSTTWSPILKKLIALATVKRELAIAGTLLEVEITVEAQRHSVTATVVKTPFFNPQRKTMTPAP